MKTLLKIFFSFFVLLSILLLVIFFYPTIIINPSVLKFGLNKSGVLDEWSWKNARFQYEWITWNERKFAGNIDSFCFKKITEGAEAKSCLEKISWNFNLGFSLDEGIYNISNEPIILRSSLTEVKLLEQTKPKEKSPPPDVKGYWNILWSDFVPDMDFKFSEIRILDKEKDTKFDVILTKIKKDLLISALDFTLKADPEGFSIEAPKKYPLKKDLGTTRPLFFRDLKLKGKMQDDGIPLEFTGFFETVILKSNAFFALPIKDDTSSAEFRKKILQTVTFNVTLPGLKKNLKDYSPEPYDELPAPFNSLDGKIMLDGKVNPESGNNVLVSTMTSINLSDPHQAFAMDIGADIPLDVLTFARGLIKISLDFKNVKIQLPRLSKKELPPQFFPDGRFKKNVPEKPKPAPEMNIHLLATGDKAVIIKTNLLDEPVGFNFDLNMKDKALSGYLNILAFKTKIFKRTIKLLGAHIVFNKTKDPVIKAQVQFPLPEYKIDLFIEGPVSKPRYAFRSDPPLPQSDIYSVLLFGRPMEDLGTEDKTAAQKTNQILSQGLLSLSTLYFLSGGPVEHVGYDPGTNNVTAQFGLTDKTSLRVGGGSDGLNSTSVRRSLGKGWYLDSSVQNSSSTGVQQQKNKNYGVLLERIISY